MLTGEDWNEKQKRENPYMADKDKIAKGVTEAVDLSSEDRPSEEAAMLMESYGLGYNGSNTFATSIYSVGDVILAGLNKDGCRAADLAKFMKTDGVFRNVVVRESDNTIVAREMIYPTEPFSV